MLTAMTFWHGWNTTINRNDALFWAQWLSVPGRFTIPDAAERPGVAVLDVTSMPSNTQIATNLQTLFERIPASYAKLAQVMYTLRVRDALPSDATDEQQQAAEAMAMAGELDALYDYGSQIVRMQVLHEP